METDALPRRPRPAAVWPMIGALAACAGCATGPAPPASLPAPAATYTEEEVRAFANDMSGFLSSVALRQQEFHRAEGRFAPSLLDLGMSRPTGYDIRIVEGTERGWSAEAYRASPRLGCSIFAGIVTALPQPNSPVQAQAGRPYCAYAPSGAG